MSTLKIEKNIYNNFQGQGLCKQDQIILQKYCKIEQLLMGMIKHLDQRRNSHY